MRTNHLLLFLLLHFALLPSLAIGNIEKTIVLRLNGTQMLYPSSGSKIFNANKRVLVVSERGKGLLLKGKTSGESLLKINHATYRVVVLKAAPFETYSNLQAVIKDFKGLILDVNEGLPIVKGRLLRLSDWKDMAHALEDTNAHTDVQYHFTASIDADIKDAAMTMIETQLRNHLLPSPQITLVPYPKILLGTELASHKPQYHEALRAYGLKILKSSHSVSLEPVVSVEILVTELRRKHFRRMGLKYPTAYEAQALPSPAFNQPLLVSIEAIEENGWGRVLASPRLICKSGKEASFLAGGEIPVRTTGFQSGSVAWKKYGVQLNVKPKADRSGRISLELTTEVSSIDTSQVVDGIPGLLMNRIQTHFDLARTQTIALSGLIKNEQGRSKEGLPWLQNIPVLGLLFSSQEYREHQTELVIFVTPRVLDPTDMPIAELPADVQEGPR